MISVIKLCFRFLIEIDFVYFIDKVFRIYLVYGVYCRFIYYFLNKVNGM